MGWNGLGWGWVGRGQDGVPGQHPGAVSTHSWFSGKNWCTLMPQFPHLSKDMTMPFENLGALWLEVTTSAVLLRLPEIETVCDTILSANILSDEKFMPFLKHFFASTSSF